MRLIMNVEKRSKIIIDWINDYCDNTSFKPKSLVVGISGGIDSSVVSTLCALTNRKTIPNIKYIVQNNHRYY